MIHILEGNKLIAEFMGYKYYPENVINYEAGTLEKDGCLSLHANSINKNFCTEYHSSWNKLMPVIEKIEAINDEYHGHFGVYISSNTCSIQSTKFRPDKKIPDQPNYFNCITLDTKIDSTWTMVVNFIKWYNKNK